MKFKIILIIIILAVLGGAFYWFEWRPSQIRKECYFRLQIGGGFSKEKDENDLPSLKMLPVPSEKADEFYRNCLREHGLER